MSAPLITVLMTVYNGGEYLRSSLESVLRQTHSDFEFLIINDCSSDLSAQVIRSFSDQRIRLIENEVNLGQTRSLNKGLSLARGRYIARIDADDLAFPQWLKKNLALIQSQPQAAVISCKAVVIDGHGHVQKTLNTPLSYEEMILRSLTASPVNHVGSLFKKDVVTSVGGYDERLKIVADYELWSTLIRKGLRLASGSESLVAVRVHERSVSVSERGRKDVGEMTQVMARNFKALTTLSLTEEEINGVWRSSYAAHDMDTQDFLSAVDLLARAYHSLRPEYPVPAQVIERYTRRRQRALYMKKAFWDISDGNMAPLRVLACDYQRSAGLLNMFSLLWLGSWLGKGVMQVLPGLYARLQKSLARRKVRGQFSLEMVHGAN